MESAEPLQKRFEERTESGEQTIREKCGGLSRVVGMGEEKSPVRARQGSTYRTQHLLRQVEGAMSVSCGRIPWSRSTNRSDRAM